MGFPIEGKGTQDVRCSTEDVFCRGVVGSDLSS